MIHERMCSESSGLLHFTRTKRHGRGTPHVAGLEQEPYGWKQDDPEEEADPGREGENTAHRHPLRDQSRDGGEREGDVVGDPDGGERLQNNVLDVTNG